MTRIISGDAGGRRLRTPPGSSTRPTSDRVREALFSRLEHRGLLDGTRVLDLYAGSGAVGLEARSRGAGVVTFVEQDRRTAALITRNAAALGFSRSRVIASAVATALQSPPAAPYDLPEEALAAVLTALVERGWLGPESFVVVERSTRSPQPRWPAGLEFSGEKRYGETAMWFAEPTPHEVVA